LTLTASASRPGASSGVGPHRHCEAPPRALIMRSGVARRSVPGEGGGRTRPRTRAADAADNPGTGACHRCTQLRAATLAQSPSLRHGRGPDRPGQPRSLRPGPTDPSGAGRGFGQSRPSARGTLSVDAM